MATDPQDPLPDTEEPLLSDRDAHNLEILDDFLKGKNGGKALFDKLYTYALRLNGNNPSIADEIMSDTMFDALKRRRGYDPSKNPQTWLYRVTRNASINRFRRESRHSKDISLALRNGWNDFNHDQDLELIDDGPSPPESAMASEVRERCRKAFNEIEPKFRNILELCYIQDIKYDTIGDILNLPRGTVNSTLNRAKARFREIYLQYCPLDERPAGY